MKRPIFASSRLVSGRSRLILFWSILVTGAFLLAACGGQPDPTEAPPTPEPTAAEEATATTAPPTPLPPTETPSATPTPGQTPVEPTATTPPAEPTPTYSFPDSVLGNDGVYMNLIPTGQLWMGSNLQFIQYAVRQCEASSADDGCDESDFINEAPDHGVEIDAFYMDISEVTNHLYRHCVDHGPCTPPTDLRFFDDDQYRFHPVVFVTWHDARTYCEYARKRLPTEAEWERAARGPGFQQFPWGDEWDPSRANTQEEGPGALQPVGQYPDGASPFGILDMSGNAWEWVNDWYDADYYQYSPQDNPLGPPSGSEKVLRGGGFGSYLHYARTANRGSAAPDTSSLFRGFRCAMSASSPP